MKDTVQKFKWLVDSIAKSKFGFVLEIGRCGKSRKYIVALWDDYNKTEVFQDDRGYRTLDEAISNTIELWKEFKKRYQGNDDYEEEFRQVRRKQQRRKKRRQGLKERIKDEITVL